MNEHIGKYASLYHEWLEQKRNICQCGCGEKINISETGFAYYIKRYSHPPYFIKNHRKRKYSRKYEEEYREWIASGPICQCGCGEKLNSTYYVYVNSIRRYKTPPKYKSYHYNNSVYSKEDGRLKRVKKDVNRIPEITFNGCSIKLYYAKETRCEDFRFCPSYLECLEKIIIDCKAVGWERIK